MSYLRQFCIGWKLKHTFTDWGHKEREKVRMGLEITFPDYHLREKEENKSSECRKVVII